MESLSVIEKISLLLAAMLMFSLGLHIGSDYKVKKVAKEKFGMKRWAK